MLTLIPLLIGLTPSVYTYGYFTGKSGTSLLETLYSNTLPTTTSMRTKLDFMHNQIKKNPNTGIICQFTPMGSNVYLIDHSFNTMVIREWLVNTKFDYGCYSHQFSINKLFEWYRSIFGDDLYIKSSWSDRVVHKNKYHSKRRSDYEMIGIVAPTK